jgi:hypothetical protein
LNDTPHGAEAFLPQQARAILERLELHYTPNMAVGESMTEIEISILERGCLSHAVGDRPTLQSRIEALAPPH